MFVTCVTNRNGERTAADIRAVVAALTVFVIPKSHALCQLLTNTARNYAAVVWAKGPQHGLGSPDVHLFMQCLPFLEQGQNFENKTEIGTVLQRGRDGEMDRIAPACDEFQVAKLRDMDRMRLQCSVSSDCHQEVEVGLLIVGLD